MIWHNWQPHIYTYTHTHPHLHTWKTFTHHFQLPAFAKKSCPQTPFWKLYESTKATLSGIKKCNSRTMYHVHHLHSTLGGILISVCYFSKEILTDTSVLSWMCCLSVLWHPRNPGETRELLQWRSPPSKIHLDCPQLIRYLASSSQHNIRVMKSTAIQLLSLLLSLQDYFVFQCM